MKKNLLVGMLVLMTLVFCIVVSASAAAVLASITDAEEETTYSELADEETDESQEEFEAASAAESFAEAAPGAAPEELVRWSYAVPLNVLYSPYSVLVNRNYLLEDSFVPNNLIKMNVKRATTAAVYMEQAAGQALEKMFEAALVDGYKLFLKSGYRSYGTQKTLYSNYLSSNNGKDNRAVAPPGASEHQLGLSCDILNEDYAGRPRMTTDFSQTAEAKWLKENCATYGFILRYLEDKTDITEFIFEPWHFRYVGREIAGYVTQREITMEEFWDEWQAKEKDFLESGGDVQAWMSYEAERALLGPEAVYLDKYGEDGDREVSLSFF